MQGRRLEDYFDDREGFTWDEVKPGDYFKCRGPQQDGVSFIVCAPNGDHGRICSRVWYIEEHDDGSITVSPSIWCNTPNGWHGYLEKGVWRSV